MFRIKINNISSHVQRKPAASQVGTQRRDELIGQQEGAYNPQPQFPSGCPCLKPKVSHCPWGLSRGFLSCRNLTPGPLSGLSTSCSVPSLLVLVRHRPAFSQNHTGSTSRPLDTLLLLPALPSLLQTSAHVISSGRPSLTLTGEDGPPIITSHNPLFLHSS